MSLINKQSAAPVISVQDLTLSYGDKLIQSDLNFTVDQGDVFVIMGGSGCGKSTLLKHLIGLYHPARGRVLFRGQDYFAASESEQLAMRRRWGVTYQGGALFSAMTLAENIALPMEQHTDWSRPEIKDRVSYKLALVGLAGYEDYYPSEISGGMGKRAGLARSIALDPEILFFDEPSAGLDPLSACRLDELILELGHSSGATVIIVTHELASIFAIGNNGIFLDANTGTQLETGSPSYMLKHSQHSLVREFLSRGEGSGF